MSKGPRTCGHSKTFILEREFRMIPCPLCRIAALEAAMRLVRPFVDESLGQSVDAALAPKEPT